MWRLSFVADSPNKLQPRLFFFLLFSFFFVLFLSLSLSLYLALSCALLRSLALSCALLLSLALSLSLSLYLSLPLSCSLCISGRRWQSEVATGIGNQISLAKPYQNDDNDAPRWFIVKFRCSQSQIVRVVYESSMQSVDDQGGKGVHEITLVLGWAIGMITVPPAPVWEKTPICTNRLRSKGDARKGQGKNCQEIPGPPFLAFLDSLAFFLLRCSLAFGGVFAFLSRHFGAFLGERLRGNTTRGVSERTSENLRKSLKTSKNLWKPLKTSENPLKTLPLGDPLRDPLRGRLPSQRLSVLLPLIVLPLLSFSNFTARKAKKIAKANKQGTPRGIREFYDTSRQFLTIFRHVTTISDNFVTCLSLCSSVNGEIMI